MDLHDILEDVDLHQLAIALDAEECERDLATFLQRAWPAFDPSKFEMNWHIEAICEHLEAVSAGEIKRLLINEPPRHTKTATVAVSWPCWTWAKRQIDGYPLIGPHVRFLCTSYGSEKAQEDAVTARRLIASPWYQERWGHRVMIAKDRDNQERYDTTAGGSRVSVGLGGAVLGRGGDIKIIDDPIKTDDANNSLPLNNVIRAYDEMFASRATDPRTTAEVIIMQRLHENDLSGHVISKNLGFEHLCIPAEYESDRHCVTSIGWEDPRGCDRNGDTLPDDERVKRDGTLIWPGRFGKDELAVFKSQPYTWAGQYQQRPEPRGGGIIKPEWWNIWPPEGEEFDETGKPLQPLVYPPMDYVLAYLDTALTSKTVNDPSGLIVWGSWRGPEGRVVKVNSDGSRASEEDILLGSAPRIMLMEAWTGHFQFHDLVKKAIDTCRKRKVDRLIIEAKQNGQSVAQEIMRLCGGETFGVMRHNPKGDKDSRLHSVSHLFTADLVWRPNRRWAEKVVDQCSLGSKGSHDEMADCTSGGLRFLRNIGEALTTKEYQEEVRSEYAAAHVEHPYDDIL